MDVNNISPEKLESVLASLELERAQSLAENRLASYKPYPKQAEFHAAGATHRERLLMAANRFGKTICGAAELAFHLTGAYPLDWKGRRFDKPVRAWAAGVTGETTRDVLQQMLLGPPFREAEWGTGYIPKAAIAGVATSRGIPGAIDTVSVRHISGGLSSLQFKSYEKGREKWQGAALECVYFDEEPDEDIYSEGLTRTNETNGIVYLCFTPLLGISTVVQRFMGAKQPDRAMIQATIDDAPHFSEEKKAQLIASYRPHELEARTKGIPVLGSGRIFTAAESDLICDPFEIPSHWLRWGGMDFGWTHYFAAVELAYDRDLDVIYLVRTLRLRLQNAIQHAAAIRSWNLTWAWPCDGRRQTLEGAGIPLMQQYADAGLDMMRDHAQYDGGERAIWAGIDEMQGRMGGGRWKVFKGANEAWLEEYRLYHTDRNGNVVSENDDAISASRYALMMKRHARTAGWKREFYRPIQYPPLGIV